MAQHPQDQALVKVVYRGVTLLESSVMQDLDDEGGFIQTDRPMPVGTALFIHPEDKPELEVGVAVAKVVEVRKVRRGAEQPQAGMTVTFQASAEEFFASLHTFDAEETSFELEAEPPDGDDEDEAAAADSLPEDEPPEIPEKDEDGEDEAEAEGGEEEAEAEDGEEEAEDEGGAEDDSDDDEEEEDQEDEEDKEEK